MASAQCAADDALCALAVSGVAAVLGNLAADANAEGGAWTLGLEDRALQLRVFHSPVPGSPLLRFKGVCEVPGFAPQFVQAAVSDNAPRLRWDSNIAALDTLALRGEGAPAGAPPAAAAASGVQRVVLLRSATRPVGPISAREFVDVTAICDDGFAGVPAGSVVSAGVGVAADARFPEAPGFVRGINSASGWVFERTAEGGTRVHYVIHSDLKGWFMAFVVNSAITGSYQTFFGDLKRRLAELKALGSTDGREPAAA